MALRFRFDRVYDETSSQQDIYSERVSSIVEGSLEGFNGTVFAYGQTGTGKTHTMTGSANDPGIVPRAFSRIFRVIEKEKETQRSFAIRVRYVEIYMEGIRDLLAKETSVEGLPSLPLRESPEGVFVQGAVTPVCRTLDDVRRWFDVGSAKRTTASTLMNEQSLC